ncbi:MAG: hypothetical protein ABMA64_29605 [Myxococcota bacterium]
MAGEGKAESTGLAMTPAAPRVTGREWALAVCLFLVANYSALSVLDSWLAPWEVVPSGSWFVTTIGYRLLIAVTGACARPRSVGVTIAATALMWLASAQSSAPSPSSSTPFAQSSAHAGSNTQLSSTQ